jgi:RNA polymerase sigma-70 factor (ECF subfamily)
VASLERLLRRHQQAMFRLAYRLLNDRGDAEDAVQDAFVSAWRRLDTYRGDAAFSSWLYRIVTNRCFNMTRSRRPVATLDAAETVIAASGHNSPENEATATAERAALQRALQELPVDQRACWVLRENDGLGYDEIAGIIGGTPDAVRGKIHRARHTLAQRMREWT